MSKAWNELIKRSVGKSDWDFANRQLYTLCERHPLHVDPSVIIAKVWLIGRSYAAAIERGRLNAEPGDGFYEETVAPTIKRSEIDDWIKSVVGRPPTAEGSTETILSVHGEVTRLFRTIANAGNERLLTRNKRSLASKYLHFHCPKHFFIYDTRAVQGMRLLNDALDRTRASYYDGADHAYSSFAQRCTYLRDWIKANLRAVLLPRQIDNLLLTVCAEGSPGPLNRR